MTEEEIALATANQWLDGQMNPLTQMVPGEPDCEACVLARQYIRLLDRTKEQQKQISLLKFDLKEAYEELDHQ